MIRTGLGDHCPVRKAFGAKYRVSPFLYLRFSECTKAILAKSMSTTIKSYLLRKVMKLAADTTFKRCGSGCRKCNCIEDRRSADVVADVVENFVLVAFFS